MDEIESVKLIKKLIKIFLTMLLPIIVLFCLEKIINGNLIFKSVFNVIINFFCIVEFWILMIAIPMIVYVSINKVREWINSKNNIAKNEEYIRDIEIKYSPAIISLVLDLQTSCFKDYTATILYLCYRKYVSMYKEKNQIKFEVINENEKDLNPHEQYVYRCIGGGGFEETKFKRLVMEDARDLNLIIVNKEKIKRTQKGKNEANLWKGFKNYIHDYTLISEKDIDHMVILKEYIPYAIALGEAKNIEKFIADDETYRNLIYKFYNGEDERFKDN